SVERSLATLWVKRATYGKWTVGGLGSLGIALGIYQFGVVAPRQRAADATRIELTEALPRQLTAAHQAVTAEAQVPIARQRADAPLPQGRPCPRAGRGGGRGHRRPRPAGHGAPAGIHASDRRTAAGRDRLLPRASALP